METILALHMLDLGVDDLTPCDYSQISCDSSPSAESHVIESAQQAKS